MTDKQERRKLIILFVLQTCVHVAHTFEEMLGRLFIIDLIGNSTYVILNSLTFGFVVIAFLQSLRDKRWAYRVMLVYSVAMTVNGVGHLVGRFLLQDWLGKMAGEYTGAILIVLAPTFLIHLLRWHRLNSRYQVVAPRS